MVELLFLDFLLLCGCISELSVVVHWCVYVYIYICVCVCVYVYVYIPLEPYCIIWITVTL